MSRHTFKDATPDERYDIIGVCTKCGVRRCRADYTRITSHGSTYRLRRVTVTRYAPPIGGTWEERSIPCTGKPSPQPQARPGSPPDPHSQRAKRARPK